MVKIDGLDISYERYGQGPRSVLFVHGNSSSKKAFRFQLEDPDLQKFSLIAVDLPGHGSSQWDLRAEKNTEIYSLPYFSNFIISFIKALELNNLVAIGHSLGGHILAMASRELALKGFFSFQAPPIEDTSDIQNAFSQTPELALFFSPEIDLKLLRSFSETYFVNEKFSKEVIQDFKLSDPLCRKNLGLSLTDNINLKEVSKINALNCAKSIAYGASDPMINKTYLNSIDISGIWKDSIIEIENSGHYPQLEKASEFNSLIINFIDFSYRD